MAESCPFHQKGHCKNKSKCALNHNIPNCNMGLFCKNKNSCTSRHVRACNLLPNCPYKKCSYNHHPIAPTLPPLLPIPLPAFQPPTQPPHPHPRSLPLLPDPTWYCRRIQDLESQVHKLSSDRLAISNKPDLEAGEGCLNVNKDIKKFLGNVSAWSNKLDELFADSKAQAKMITEIAESHQGLGKI